MASLQHGRWRELAICGWKVMRSREAGQSEVAFRLLFLLLHPLLFSPLTEFLPVVLLHLCLKHPWLSRLLPLTYVMRDSGMIPLTAILHACPCGLPFFMLLMFHCFRWSWTQSQNMMVTSYDQEKGEGKGPVLDFRLYVLVTVPKITQVLYMEVYRHMHWTWCFHFGLCLCLYHVICCGIPSEQRPAGPCP